MAGSVGKLKADVIANASQFRSEMESLASDAPGWADKLMKSFSGGGGAGGLAGVGIGDALGKLIGGDAGSVIGKIGGGLLGGGGAGGILGSIGSLDTVVADLFKTAGAGEELASVLGKLGTGNLWGGIAEIATSVFGSIGKDLQTIYTAGDAVEKAAEAAPKFTAEMESLAKASEQVWQDSWKLIDGLKEEIATFGMGADAAARYKLEQAGASQSMLAEVTALQQKKAWLELEAKATKDASDAQQAMLTRGAQLAEQARSPMEQYLATIEDLQKLLSVGAIGDQVAAFHAAASAAKLGQAQQAQGAGPPPLIEFGTQAYFGELAQREARAANNLNPEQREQLVELRHASRTLGQILEILESQKPMNWEVN